MPGVFLVDIAPEAGQFDPAAVVDIQCQVFAAIEAALDVPGEGQVAPP